MTITTRGSFRRYQTTVLNARAIQEAADALRGSGAEVIPEAVELLDRVLAEITPVVVQVRVVTKLVTGSSYHLVVFSNGQTVRVTGASDNADAIYRAQHS